MDFAVLPPEINSGRIYAGPGSAPMLAAAAAWDGLAAEFYSGADSYQSIVSTLATGPWTGPSAAAMLASATHHVAWMHTTAGHAALTGAQVKMAATAYEAAFAAHVPPPVIAANRTLLMALVATNLLGQNTPAIAATEAHYGEMWAQDVAAMFGYHASSAVAAQIAPFAAAATTTNPVSGLSSLSGLISPLSSVTSAVSGLPGILSSLGVASPAAAASLPGDVLAPYSATAGTISMGIGGHNLQIANEAAPFIPGATAGSLGRAASLGGLSVPPGWAAAAPAVKLAANGTTIISAAPAAGGMPGGMMPAGIPGGVLGQSLLGGLAGRGIGSFGKTHSVMPTETLKGQPGSA